MQVQNGDKFKNLLHCSGLSLMCIISFVFLKLYAFIYNKMHILRQRAQRDINESKSVLMLCLEPGIIKKAELYRHGFG